jgi:Raf kinase inhibitor-like YbhB/YbcL family protein
MAFTVTSSAFADGQTVPKQFTCDGDDAPPPIAVNEPPTGTKSFAVIADDPDAPKGTFTHWLAYNIPADGKVLRATEGKTLKNDFGRTEYGGPCPLKDTGSIATTSRSMRSTSQHSTFQATAATIWKQH